jgi:uncharacterized membrane protein HdeD (DUF308 family)
MVDVTEYGNDDVLARIGRAWGWMLAIGIVTALLGLAVIVFPGATLLVIAILLGIQLIVLGVFRFVEAFATPAKTGWLRAVSAVLAIVAFGVGVYLLRHPFASLLVLAVVLGIFWIANGVMDLFLAAGDPRIPARAWVVVSAVLAIVAGAIVLFYPAISLLTLTVVLGVWLVIYGVILAVRAINVRSATEQARAGVHGGRMSPT